MDRQQVGRHIPFFAPDIGPDEIAAVTEVLRSGWLTSGPTTERFEGEFAAYVGAAHAVAVNSCTSALHLSLVAAGIGPGHEVLVPTLTFAATAATVIHTGARPVLVDCEPGTLNIDVAAAAAAVTEATRAVVPVHFAGQPCDMDAVVALASAHDLVVVEDAAHALPSWYRDRMIGTIGTTTCFSFYATKTITTGEGGMITTQDADLAERIRLMGRHGVTKSSWDRYGPSPSWDYAVVAAGYKYGMSDVAAALGVAQLARADEFAHSRADLVARYRSGLAPIPAIRLLEVAPDVRHSWHLLVARLDLSRLTISRARFIDELGARGIGASVHFRPLHLQPFYRDTFEYLPEDFPVATAAFPELVSLPLFPKMSHEDVATVVAAVEEIAGRYAR